MAKEVAVISRKWKNPQIDVFITDIEVGARMDLIPFLDALCEQVGNPTLMVTKQQLFNKLQAASVEVLREMKIATRYA
jgi:hypothetical protein